MNKWIFKDNNLDLIRLLAALQVAILHSWEYILPDYSKNIFLSFISIFPGVPIFFFISGMLISKSFERSPSLFSYTKNRILRLYPALFLCVSINILLIYSTGYFEKINADVGDIFILFIAKSSILQIYNPDFMRLFGDGVLNGSLWTIFVELQFYFLIPFIYMILVKNHKVNNFILTSLILLFIGFNYLLTSNQGGTVLWKLFRVSFLPWFYMFLFGIFVQKNFETLSKLLNKISLIYIFAVYIFLAFVFSYLGYAPSNHISPVLFFVLSLLIVSFAYSKGRITSYYKTIFKGNDFSYGIYLWHMVFVNHFLYYNLMNNHLYLVIISVLYFSTAFVSWHFIEHPALKLKKYTIKMQPEALRQIST